MLRKSRKQRVSEETLCDSPGHTYEGGSQTTEHGHNEAEIRMNMQAVQYELSTNIAYGYSLQRSTNVLPNEALYAEIDTF